jgi:hypothetical protein
MKAADAEIAALRASMPPKTRVEPEPERVVDPEVKYGLIPEPAGVQAAIAKVAKRVHLHRLADGSVVDLAATKKKKKKKSDGNGDFSSQAGYQSFYGNDPDQVKQKKRAKKLGKPISEKKRQKMLAKASAIVDPVQREAELTFIGKLATAQPKVKPFIGKRERTANARAMAEEQLYDPDPRRRDVAWLRLHPVQEANA